MYHYSYEDVEETDDPADVAFHNMNIGDKRLNLAFFIAGARGWMTANKDKSFYDLEKELRKRSFDTHLYAKKTNRLKGSILGIPGRINDVTEYKYECIFSCRPKNDALKEVLQHWRTYEENLEALKQTGYVTITDVDSIKNKPNMQKFEDTEGECLNLVCENKKKIMESYKSAEVALSEINQRIKKQYGYDPVYKVVCSCEKGLVHGATIGNKVVSEIGYIELHDKKGNMKLELVQLG